MFEGQNKLLTVISQLKQADQFKNYIEFIQFPYYRNLELNAKINFDFPFTVFIGQNGCGKSSALHALFGTVKGKTPFNFWFDTKVDPIQYYNDEKKRHSFWYRYKDDTGTTKEVVKARIKRADNPNYWETSRPLTWAGMAKGKRNEPIEKNVIYLDFRGELSAFDKFFYFGDLKNVKSKNKQEFIRRRSSLLKRIFDKDREYVKSRYKKLNDKLEVLSKQELEYISYILGRSYSSCESVRHSIFRNEGYSILFQTEYAKYSEAFAGSGEMAIVRLVKEVLTAPMHSLILLDEPEVSLHPGAQVRLKLFLLDQIKIKKHQVVLTSHSPIIIKDLPKNAIKVFYQNLSNGRFLIKEDLVPEEAFFHIELPIDNRKNIIVEDKLSKEIITAVLQSIGSASENLFNIKYYPGGQSVLKKDFIPVFCREPRSKEFIIFDGDQKSSGPFNWREKPIGQVTVKLLHEKIKELTKEEIKFPVDSWLDSSNQEQQLELLKLYLDFYNNNVFFLPKLTPEELIWDNEKAHALLSIKTQKKEESRRLFEDVLAQATFKKKFSKLAYQVSGDSSSDSIFYLQKIFIQSWVEASNNDYKEIVQILSQMINRHD